MERRRLAPLCVAITLLTASVCSCVNQGQYRQSEGAAWHTLYHITYRSSEILDDSIRAVIDSVDRSLSFFNPESTVSKLNTPTCGATVDEMTAEVYTLSRRVFSATDSIFDPTVSPAITAWGFGKGHKITPDTLVLDSLKQFVGLEKSRLVGNVIRKDDPRTEFNFSAVAKGYGVDRVAKMLERNGVTDYLIEIGGEIRAKGVNRQGQKWRVAIDSPDEGHAPGDEYTETVAFSDMSMATSGNYRNFHKNEKGQQFGHTISPRTLRPVSTDLLSVTVMAPNCAEADALATSCMAMGYRRSDSLLNSLGYPALFIVRTSTDEMKVIRNTKLKELMVK